MLHKGARVGGLGGTVYGGGSVGPKQSHQKSFNFHEPGNTLSKLYPLFIFSVPFMLLLYPISLTFNTEKRFFFQ